MEIIKQVNSSSISLIRTLINNQTYYVTLLKTRLSTISSEFTYDDLKAISPNVLIMFRVNTTDSNIKLSYDTGDSSDYDILYNDLSSGSPIVRYLKFIDINNSTELNDLVNNHSDVKYWMYVSTTTNWETIPEEYLSSNETYYNTILLTDLYNSNDLYLNELPNNGIILSYHYKDDGTQFEFSKTNPFKDIFEFYIKVTI